MVEERTRLNEGEMADPAGKVSEVTISIDGLMYRCDQTVLSAEDVRKIPHPPIESDRDLWLEEPGGVDRFLAQNDQIAMSNGLRFFTAPRSILAGACARTALHIRSSVRRNQGYGGNYSP